MDGWSKQNQQVINILNLLFPVGSASIHPSAASCFYFECADWSSSFFKGVSHRKTLLQVCMNMIAVSLWDHCQQHGHRDPAGTPFHSDSERSPSAFQNTEHEMFCVAWRSAHTMSRIVLLHKRSRDVGMQSHSHNTEQQGWRVHTRTHTGCFLLLMWRHVILNIYIPLVTRQLWRLLVGPV